MRPVGEPRGKYLRRELGVSRPGSMEVHSPVSVSRTDRWLADPYHAAGLCTGDPQIHQAARAMRMADLGRCAERARPQNLRGCRAGDSGAGYGSRPAIMVIDINYNFCGDSREPILESIKRWHFSCGERAWDGIEAIATDFASGARQAAAGDLHNQSAAARTVSISASGR